MKKSLTLLFITLITIGLNAQIDRSQMPQAGPAPEINLQDPQRFELQNGLEVLVVENHKLPRVSIQLRIDNPPVLEGDKDLAYTQLINKRYYSPDFLILAYTPKADLFSKNTLNTMSCMT